MWTLVYADAAASKMRRLDQTTARRIRFYLEGVIQSGDPRSRGKGLSGPLAGYWSYRVGDYRILVSLHDMDLVVIALDLGHRSTIYTTNK